MPDTRHPCDAADTESGKSGTMDFDRPKSNRYTPPGEVCFMTPPSLRTRLRYRDISAAQDQDLPRHRCRQCDLPAKPEPGRKEPPAGLVQLETKQSKSLSSTSKEPSEFTKSANLTHLAANPAIVGRKSTDLRPLNAGRYSADARHQSTESTFARATGRASQIRDF